jgi:hypothetical protein
VRADTAVAVRRCPKPAGMLVADHRRMHCMDASTFTPSHAAVQSRANSISRRFQTRLVWRCQNSNHGWHSKNADFAGQRLEFQLSGFMESLV